MNMQIKDSIYDKGLIYYLEYLSELTENDLSDELNLTAEEFERMEEPALRDHAINTFNIQWKELSTSA